MCWIDLSMAKPHQNSFSWRCSCYLICGHVIFQAVTLEFNWMFWNILVAFLLWCISWVVLLASKVHQPPHQHLNATITCPPPWNRSWRCGAVTGVRRQVEPSTLHNNPPSTVHDPRSTPSLPRSTDGPPVLNLIIFKAWFNEKMNF